MTSMEREDKEKIKKKEKKLEDEETLQQATWVKYTFPIKHQVQTSGLCLRGDWLQLLMLIMLCGSDFFVNTRSSKNIYLSMLLLCPNANSISSLLCGVK